MIKVRTWILTALSLAVAALLLWVIVDLRSDKIDAVNLNNAYKGVISRYSIQVGDMKEQVYEANLKVADRERDLVLSIEQVARLRELNIRNVRMIGSLNLSLKAYKDSLLIKHGTDTITLVKYVQDSTGFFHVPSESTWGWEDEWAESYAGIDSDGYGYSGFDVKPFEIEISLGSRGLFKKDYVSVVSTDMPYIDVSGIDMNIVKQKKAAPFLYGTAFGVILTSILLGVL